MKKPKIRALQNAEESKARIIQQVNSRLDEQPKRKVSRLLPLTAGLLAAAVALFYCGCRSVKSRSRPLGRRKKRQKNY